MTTYPAMTDDQARRAWDSDDNDNTNEWTKGSGPLIEMAVFDQLAEELSVLKSLFPDITQSRGDRRWDRFEAEAAEVVHRRLTEVDRSVLADMDFWTWLAMEKLPSIVNWRYRGEHGRASPANFGIKSRRENFVYRLWLQGEIGFDPNRKSYDLVNVPGRDLWRSHIFRQNYANSRSLARALLRLQSSRLQDVAPLDKYAIREMAKLLARLGSNVLFGALSDSDADQLVLEHVDEAKRLGELKRTSDAERRVQRRSAEHNQERGSG